MKTPEERYQEIGQKIKQAREKVNMTQADLAQKLQFESPTAISLLEGGRRSITIHTLEKMADVLGVPLQHLLGTEGSVPPLKYVLRSSEGMNEQSAKTVAEFAEFMKKKHGRDQA